MKINIPSLSVFTEQFTDFFRRNAIVWSHALFFKSQHRLHLPPSLVVSIEKVNSYITKHKSVEHIDKSAPSLKRPLKIQEIRVTNENVDKMETVQKITKLWHEIAGNKQEEAKNAHERKLFKDSAMISDWIVDKIGLELTSHYYTSAYSPAFESVVVCHDEALNAQAIALVSRKCQSNGDRYLYVHLLATNPINIRSECNKNESKRVEGAGTAIIHHLAKLCLEEGIDSIELLPLNSAQPFYQKVGFEIKSSGMILKKEKMQKIFTTALPQAA